MTEQLSHELYAQSIEVSSYTMSYKTKRTNTMIPSLQFARSPEIILGQKQQILRGVHESKTTVPPRRYRTKISALS